MAIIFLALLQTVFCILHNATLGDEFFSICMAQSSSVVGDRQFICVFRLNASNLKHFYNVTRNFQTFLTNTLWRASGDSMMQIFSKS